MKLFIKKIIYFLIIPVILIVIMDTWLRYTNSLYSAKYNGALKNKNSIEVLILGNSHATYGVDPNAFSLNAYNMANVGQSIYFDKRITTSILDSLPDLKYVLISIDYHSLYFSSQGLRNIWSYYGNDIRYKDNRYLLENISPFLFGYTPKVSLALLKKRLVNYLKYGKECLSYNVEAGINIQNQLMNGFISFDKKNNPEFFTEEAYKARVDVFNKKIHSSMEKEEVLSDLEDFISQLIDHKVTPVLFTTPTFVDYNTYLDSQILNKNNKHITHLCEKYNLKYFDFMNSDCFSIEDYFNADHLNKDGANKFAKLLSDSIVSVGVSGHHKQFSALEK